MGDGSDDSDAELGSSETLAESELTSDDRVESVEEVPRVVDVSAPRVDALRRYELRRALGSGGMGDIELVQDTTIGREVALKQLRAVNQNPRAQRRFEREARLQGQLEHPAIVPVYDIGLRPDGLPFFTMKRVRGDSLGDILGALAHDDLRARMRFARRRLLSALSQVCLAAHYAHERGVVHRDIKPDNIMLGRYGEVYLIDWGIAKIVPRDPTSSDDVSATDDTRDSQHDAIDESQTPQRRPSVHTGAGSIVGTLRTMAPEQAAGQTVDARSDVYALGAVLFEILTLHSLHGKGTEFEMLGRIIEGVDARPSTRFPEIEVPPELEEICVAATKRQPADRIDSARRLHERIEAYLDGDRDVEARKASSILHTERALAAAGDIENQRPTALREVGQALALDPNNKLALRTMVRLLTTPPREPPAEVVREQQAIWDKHLRRGGLVGAIVYGYISINAVFTAALGIHDWPVFLLAHALWAAAFVASLVTYFRPTYRALFVAFLCGVAASLWATGVYGPHLMVPSLLTMHAALYSMVRYTWLQRTVLAVAALAWTVSVFGELAGLFPDVVRFVDGGIFIRSPVIDFPETMTTVYLYAAVMAMILFPAVAIGSLRASYHAADEQMRMQTWQLRQLVPDEARGTIEK